MIGDLKEKVDSSQQMIEQKEVQIMQLIKDKEYLQNELGLTQKQVQTYIQQDELSHQIIREKEEELYLIKADLNENIQIREQLQFQVEQLKD